MQLIDHEVPTVLGRIQVRVGGEGPAMLFWPSLLMTGEMWQAQAAHFADRYTVVLVDPPGHGRSEALTSMFTFEDNVRCITQILDHLQIDTTHFVGNSWGGMIGGTFAARCPDRVGHAVLMNCTGSAAGRRQKLEFALLLRMARALGGIRPPVTGPAVKAFLGPTTLRTRPDVVATVRGSLERVDIRSAAWAVKSVVPARPDQLGLLGSIRTPVLVIAGKEDGTFPVAETRVMADAIPGSTLRILDGVAHLAALENPELTNRLIDEFLASPDLAL
ncbi:alpha/beta hydrolase [Actinoallomurus spadix]|uniref:Alpha/beta fold hydrolase n=1 Tax=Actinoallomurus spadix TaxID=79912 RepID=A0ABN0XLW1_9ACTN|nr:alpha/beta fold hydrolase [Actinoallomurus spadix]MCO5985144.1 alpha/beta hydrolase [Actinoallomurus spadix]